MTITVHTDRNDAGVPTVEYNLGARNLNRIIDALESAASDMEGLGLVSPFGSHIAEDEEGTYSERDRAEYDALHALAARFRRGADAIAAHNKAAGR